MKDFSKEIRAYALRNAIAHEGKAVAGSVLTPLFINQGDVLRVNTETGEYVERVAKA